MSLLLRVRRRLVVSAMLLVPFLVSGQSLVPQGGFEHSISGPLPGDQINSSISLNQDGGYVVWEENGSAKTGSEISAARLDAAGNRISTFSVNKVVKGDQIKPRVQLLANGDALFVWQSYGLGNADIYARLYTKDEKFATGDVRVNSDVKAKTSYSKDQQSEPVLTALQDGGAMIAWQSFGQDGSMMGVYARKISADGKLDGNEFLVNVRTLYNQRSPAIATLADGNIIIVWISQLQRFGYASFHEVTGGDAISVDVYGRIFSPSGEAVTGELLLNAGNNICANPSVASLSSGGFTVVWSERDLMNRSNNWEIVGRSFTAQGVATGSDFKLNTHTYGDQYRPKIASAGNHCAVVWTSLGQDGSREGVFGRFLKDGNQPFGSEIPVNVTTASQQIYPTIASNGTDQFLVSWSSFVAITGFDLFGRKYTLNQQQ